jgi:uncharacterized protein (DUF58 family)
VNARPTPRGWAVLLLSVLAFSAGEFFGFDLVRALGAAGLGTLLAAAVLTVRRVRVEVTRSVHPDRVTRGEPALARLTATARGRRQPGFFATDRAGRFTRTVRIPPSLPGVSRTLRYELPTSVRGRQEVGPLRLHRADPLGLAVNELPAGDTATLWVHPRRYPAKAPAAGYPRHHHEGVASDQALRGSTDLLEVRPYQPGDEVRHLHWKATARTGQLMVRDYADPEQPRFTLLLDTRHGVFPPAVFEEAVDLTASLLVAAGRAGRHNRLVTTGGVDRTFAGGSEAQRVLLDELSEVRQSTADASPVPASLLRGDARGGCLAVVTAAAEPGALAGLRPGFAAMFVLELGPAGAGARSVPGLLVLRAGTAAEAVARWNEAA